MSQEVSSTNKRIAKNTLFLYVRMLLVMGVSIFTSRVILQTLGVEDYGIYNAVGGIVAVIVFINQSFSGLRIGNEGRRDAEENFLGFIEFAYGCGFYCLAVG